VIYKDKNAHEMRTPVKLLIPIGTERYNGVNRCTYSTDGDVIFVNWKSYGGTETTVNGVYSILDTALITTWYRPDIAANCRLLREDGAIYEIMNEPENIEMQNVFLTFKVQRVKGGA
jgi:hypothetical protein